MKRPAFQFYPDRWRANVKLRRCGRPARSVWIDTLCVLHESDEYGVARYPLRELADVVGCPLSLLRELVDKGVLKGSDEHCDAYVFQPTHAGKKGAPVTLLAANDGPCWYSSRMVRDEYIRTKRGEGTRFGDESADHQPGNQSPPLEQSPIPPFGDGPLSLALPLASKDAKHAVDNSRSTARAGDSQSTGGKGGQVNGKNSWQSPVWVTATAQTIGLERRTNESFEAFADRVHTAINAKRRQAHADSQRRSSSSS